MKKYTWAVNKIKLQIAIAKSSDKSDSDVKRNYLKLGGKLDEEGVKDVPVEVVPASEAKQQVEDVLKEEIEPAPKKKRGRPAKAKAK